MNFLSKNIFFFFICLVVLLGNVFLTFPQMGHDYSLVFDWANDYHFAWNKFGVFNVQFSPKRCLGIPIWANPIGVNFSLFHVLSVIFNDITTVVLMITLYVALGFWGTLKFLEPYSIESDWKSYLAASWCLQGCLIMRTLEGHLSYLGLILWPMMLWLLLRSTSSRRQFFLSLLLVSGLLAHDFYSGAPPLFVMFPLAMSCAFLVLRILQLSDLKLKDFVIRLSFVLVTASIIILPKVIAMNSFVKNYQRSVSFIDVGFLNGLQYSVLSQLFPPILDYKKMTGWWYGDWESINYLFPILLLLIFCLAILRLKSFKKEMIGLIFCFGVSSFISSGIYADVIKSIPLIKSFHVNPRWVIFLNLSFLVCTLSFLMKLRWPKNLAYLFFLPSLVFPFMIRDRENLELRFGYHPSLRENKTAICYEPVFGYNLELFPFEKIQKGKYLDPRCYLKPEKCSDFILPGDQVKNLETYQLKPFP